MNVTAGFVVDASVLVARVRRSERYHKDARAVLAVIVAGRHSLYVPTVAFAEVAAAISRGADSSRWAVQAVIELRRLPGLRSMVVDDRLSTVAAQIAALSRIRGCDAVYVALAQVLGAPLVTLDRQQRERAPSSVTALTPAQTLARLS